MKKNYLLIGMMFFSVLAFSQTKAQIDLFKNAEIKKLAPTSEFEVYTDKPKTKNTKAPGDTIQLFTFDTGLEGWTATNVNSGINNFIWTWDSVYRAGSRTAGLLEINSTSGPGYLSLPSDNYNSPNVTANMNTYITSPWIQINPKQKSVMLQYEFFGYFCCGGADVKVVEVTNNGTDWVTFDATDGLPNNFINVANGAPAELVTLNVSEAAANADSVRIRFRNEDHSVYAMFIDDVALIEGATNDLILSDVYQEFNGLSYFGINPFYNQIPYDLFTPLSFSATVTNNGGDTTTNARLEMSIEHTADENGNPTNNQVYFVSTQTRDNGRLAPFPGADTVFSDTPFFVPLVHGDFRVTFEAVSDNANQFPGDEIANRTFTTTDTIFARDDGTYNGGTSPQNYVDGNGTPGGNDFDAMGTMYAIESRSNGASIPTSITYFVSADTFNVGVDIIPTVWSFDETQATIALAWDHINSIVADGSLYTVTANDLSSFITLPVSLVSGVNSLDSGLYMVGWETVGGGKPNGIRYFDVGNDAFTAQSQELPTTLIYLEHDQVSPYGLVTTQPAIRLNIGAAPIQTSVSTINTSANMFEVIPNPSNGQLKINISVENQATYNLNVRNMLGQIVYTDILSVSGAKTERLDFSSFDKGVYFLTLENDNEKLQKKVILK